ncbi:MAG TPA: GSCFA domain protein [Caldithrix abyssi]|uniref:GSCFA domain protein n=1 Tax=Caldithrix abyssi TaxID=187145 RepID=A0A7V4TYJ7_CALAY|nr:GSCFA domain protein [Caldithrix abyssi]
MPGTSTMQKIRFRTEIPLPEYPFRLEHSYKFVTLGSCFATNIADRLRSYRFSVLDNPFGVLYNPASILQSLQLLQSNQQVTKEDLIYYDEEWHSFDHHSDFSRSNAEECLQAVNSGLDKSRIYFKDAEVLMITYGTAYVYKHIRRGRIVSNCHRVPAAEFEHFRLDFADIVEMIRDSIRIARNLNPAVKIIFSISPVRYLKEGFAENQLSKALLILAVYKAIEREEHCVYFPAYEIMMDDLRDYRFYEGNLTHPNTMAIDYIWHIFSRSLLSEDCLNMMEQVKQVVQAYSHKPRNLQSKKYHQFIRKSLQFAESLKKQYTYLNLDHEITYFKEFLAGIENGKFNS